MPNKSGGTQQFRRGKVPADGTCVYWCILLLLKMCSKDLLGEDLFNVLLSEVLNEYLFKLDLMKMLNEGLRKQVANYIRSHKELHNWVLNSGTSCKTVEEYCSLIEQGKLWGGAPELRALSELLNIIICVISMTKSEEEKRVWCDYYGEDNQSAEKCVYILYDEEKGHYDPIYLMDMQNPSKKETEFDPNDEMVNDLLRTFIKEELKYDGFVRLGINNRASVNEVPSPSCNEITPISNSFLPSSSTKRKASEIDDILSPPNDDKKEPISISNEYYDSHKRIKFANAASDANSGFYNDKTDSLDIKELLETDMFDDTFDPPVNQQPIADQTTASNDEHQEKEANEKEHIEEVDDDIQNNNQFNYDSEPSS